MISSGPSTKKMSQPFTDQNAATPMPSAARPRSVERLSNENSPVACIERSLVSSIMRASSRWLTTTKIVHATRPARAYRPGDSCMTLPLESARNAAPAARTASVVLQMLKLVTSHFFRYLIQPGR